MKIKPSKSMGDILSRTSCNRSRLGRHEASCTGTAAVFGVVRKPQSEGAKVHEVYDQVSLLFLGLQYVFKYDL